MKQGQAYTVLFMVAVAAVFGGVVSAVYIASQNTLQRNEELRLQKAYVEVFQLADVDSLSAQEIADIVAAQVVEGTQVRDPETGWETALIEAYRTPERQQLKGYGFRFRGLGFWAPIEGIVAVDPAIAQTIGMVILDQKETPGLGGMIEEENFTGQFRKGLTITPPPAGKNYIQISATPPPADSPMSERHVDAITGATQTSMAMERILNEYFACFSRAMAARN
jgi:Na+-transporting NADH:ubiquinone oxidoreductase subunit C